MSLDRRGLLAAGAAGAAGLLAGCGSSARSAAAPLAGGRDANQADAAVLDDLVALEEDAVALATAALAHLRGGAHALARTICDQEQAHADQLAAAVTRLGGAARRPRKRRREPRLTGREAALAALAKQEGELIAAYLDALPKVADGRARATMAGILTTEAEHLAVLDGRLGRAEAPDALVRGAAVP